MDTHTLLSIKEFKVMTNKTFQESLSLGKEGTEQDQVGYTHSTYLSYNLLGKKSEANLATIACEEPVRGEYVVIYYILFCRYA